MKATWKECSFNLMLFPQQSCFLLLLLHKSDFFLSDFILLLEGRVGRWIPPGWNVHRTSSYLSTKKRNSKQDLEFLSERRFQKLVVQFFHLHPGYFGHSGHPGHPDHSSHSAQLCSVNQVRANFVDHPKEVLGVFLLTQVFLLREN